MSETLCNDDGCLHGFHNAPPLGELIVSYQRRETESYWREQNAKEIEAIELHSSDSYILTALIAVKDKAAAIARGKTK